MEKTIIIKKQNTPAKTGGSKPVAQRLNDGMNTPVPDHVSTHVPEGEEAALFKQAENPLGNPHQV